jgi:hypothetical protein
MSFEIKLKNAVFDPLKDTPQFSRMMVNEHNGFYLIQCRNSIQPEWLLELESIGARILSYVPDYAYVVHMEESTKALVEQLPFIRWVGYFHPFYKISAELAGLSGTTELNVVVFDTGNDYELEKVSKAIGGLGGLITYGGESNSVIRTKIDVSYAGTIATIPEVAWIDRYSEPEPAMDLIRNFTGGDKVHLGGFNGSGIVGEVKDSGIDPDHPDFDGQIIGTDGSPPVLAHGTATFGIVFSSGNNSDTAKGMLYGAQGVFASWGVGRTTSIQNLVNNWGGLFQSNSWFSGTSNGSYSAFSREDDQAVFDYDISMIYAANNGGGAQTMAQDASAKNVVSVGGLLHYNNLDRTDDTHMVGNSGNQGPTEDGRIKPDISGPYDNIYTTDIVGAPGYTPTDYHSTFGGTSGATPVVAGATGLLYQMYKADHFGNNPTGALPHASTVKAMLIANAYQYEFSQADRYEQGWGLVDIGKIYDAGPDQFIIDESVVLQTGQNATYGITPLGSQPLKFTLAWTDPPAMPFANPALINDLDLKVTAPDGVTTYWGNDGLVTGKWSTSGGVADTLNNVENVFIQTANPSDMWKVEVIASNIAQDGDLSTPGTNQHFALVVSGGVLDSQPPVTTHVVAGSQGANNWYTSPVSVTLNANDNYSGIAFTNYSLDGAPWGSYTGPFPVNGEGIHTIEYYSTDTLGNVEGIKSGVVKIDTEKPEYSSPTPLGGSVLDSDLNPIRLEINWTDSTSGISEVRFRHRLGMGSWSGWNVSSGSSGDTFWFDVPRTAWINHTGEQLDWESNGTDMAGLVNGTNALFGMSILDDDTAVPVFSNPSSDGDILDSNANSYTVRIDWTDDTGIAEVKFRYSNDTFIWSSWDNYTSAAGNTYSYEIPRADWLNSVGSNIHWQSKALDSDNDRAADGLENSTTTILGGSLGDDDVDPPSFTLPGFVDIYDDNVSDYMIQVDWLDDTGISQVGFRYRYDSDPWSQWDVYSGNSGDTYWYVIPRTEWIDHVGAVIYWESNATDNDNDRPNDALNNNTGTQQAGTILDDDSSPPALDGHIDDYDPLTVTYSINFTASDPSGWIVRVEYYYSDLPAFTFIISNSTASDALTTLTLTIPGDELDNHLSETIFWRYITEDMDGDRAGDSAATSWSAWLEGFEIDLEPPATSITPVGTMVNSEWFTGPITVNLLASDDTSGVNVTMYRIEYGQWTAYGVPFLLDQSGTFTIEYYSVDNAGNVEEKKNLTLKMDNVKPTAASGSDLNVPKDATVTLDGSGSSDNFGILSYEWKIGKDGGTIAVMFGPVQTFKFEEAGDYSVTLTVRDFAGNMDESSFSVTVPEPEEDWISQWWLIILIVVLAIVLVMVLLAFLLRRRRKHSDEGGQD